MIIAGDAIEEKLESRWVHSILMNYAIRLVIMLVQRPQGVTMQRYHILDMR